MQVNKTLDQIAEGFGGVISTPTAPQVTQDKTKLDSIAESFGGTVSMPELPAPTPERGIVPELASPFGKTLATAGSALKGLDYLTKITPLVARIGLKRLKGEDVTKDRAELVALNQSITPEEVTLELGYFGKHETVKSTREAIGVGLELGGYLAPIPIKGVALKTKATSYFVRGASFGSGNALSEGRSTTEAITQGILSGLLNVGFGMSIDVISSKATGLLNKIPKTTLKEAMAGLQRKPIENLKRQIWQVAKNEFKSILTADGMTKLVLAGGAWYKPTRKFASIALGIRYGYQMLNTPFGRKILETATKQAVTAMSKLDVTTRNEVVAPFMSKLYSELVDKVIELKQ